LGADREFFNCDRCAKRPELLRLNACARFGYGARPVSCFEVWGEWFDRCPLSGPAGREMGWLEEYALLRAGLQPQGPAGDLPAELVLGVMLVARLHEEMVRRGTKAWERRVEAGERPEGAKAPASATATTRPK